MNTSNSKPIVHFQETLPIHIFLVAQGKKYSKKYIYIFFIFIFKFFIRFLFWEYSIITLKLSSWNLGGYEIDSGDMTGKSSLSSILEIEFAVNNLGIFKKFSKF